MLKDKCYENSDIR